MKYFLLFGIGLFSLGTWAAEESYVGIGVSLERKKKDWRIVDLIEKGPAHLAGIEIGEWISAIDDENALGLKRKKLLKLLDGEENEPVKLTLLSADRESSRDVELKRELITITCFISGPVRLRYLGTARSGRLQGSIGEDYISLSVLNGMASGRIGDELVRLRMSFITNRRYSVTGRIHGSFVRWSGHGSFVTGYQNCIPE
jgi:hypothetical protein